MFHESQKSGLQADYLMKTLLLFMGLVKLMKLGENKYSSTANYGKLGAW
jgi:hypothetical protein